MYGISTTPDVANATGWSDTVPSVTNAGTYYVFWYVKGDKFHVDTEKVCIGPIVVEKEKEEVPAPAINLEYDGTVKEGVAQPADGLYEVDGGYETRAGKYTATASLKDKVNYKWAESASTQSAEVASLAAVGDSEDLQIEWEITKRNVIFNVESATKTEGDADPTFGVTIDNLVEGETLTRDVDYTLTRNEGETPGDYAVTVNANNTETMNNYAPNVNQGTLTIQAKASEGNKNVLAAAKTWLTSTGDKLAIVCVSIFAIVCASLFAMIIAKRRKKKGEEE